MALWLDWSDADVDLAAGYCDDCGIWVAGCVDLDVGAISDEGSVECADCLG